MPTFLHKIIIPRKFFPSPLHCLGGGAPVHKAPHVAAGVVLLRALLLDPGVVLVQVEHVVLALPQHVRHTELEEVLRQAGQGSSIGSGPEYSPYASRPDIGDRLGGGGLGGPECT